MTSDKAPDAFRTISEAAEDLDLPQHVLRFWETRFSQIKPLKRGGGRRYYRPDDVEFLRGLKHLLHAERYTIKGVQKIIKEQGIKAVQTAWKDALMAAPAVQPAVTTQASIASAPIAPLPTSARARLEAALAELMDCRRTMASFRQA
jgi:DNA-binding transcriptional MerR regulator